MNFYNDGENEKKEGAPVLPRAASPFKKTSAFGKSPLFSRAAGGIMDRLKNLSRKDMALVGLGLSVLTMVPAAEYMMSQPSTDNALTGGWGGKEKLSDVGPYEPGINGLSQGSSDGSGEVITPLSSRDPVSLILGSQPAQPAVTAPVYTPPASSMRDAMRDAGREAFSAASKSAGAPTVIPRMAAGLRGMSSFFGGGESSRTQGSLGGGKIIDDARSASSKAAKRSMVGPVAIAGYKGVASTPNSASKGAFEKLRAAADKSAGNFSGGSAMRSLDKAAADALDIGKGGGGMGAGGDSDKTGKTSGNTTKGYEHNRSGESLEEMAAKQRMNKALEWEFYKKYEIKKQIINAIVGAVSSVLGDFIKDKLMSAFDMYPPNIKCWNPAPCSSGNCNDVAVQAWGKDYLGKHKLKELCLLDDPVAVKTVVGKESAATSSEVCICGKGEKPTTGGSAAAASGDTTTPGGGATPGGVGSDPSSTPAHHAAAAVTSLKDYDVQLRAIVDMVAKAEADEKVTAETVTGLVGAFQNLSPLADKSITKLGNLNDATQKELDGFNTDLGTSQDKMNTVQPKYKAFDDKWDAMDKACPTAQNCNIKMKATAANKSGNKEGGPEIGNVAVLQEGVATKIRGFLDQWPTTGRVSYGAAESNLDDMYRWGKAYNAQMQPLVEGLKTITSNQGNIIPKVSELSGGSDTPLAKFQKLSGRLENVKPPEVKPDAAKEGEAATTDPAAGKVDPATTPLYLTAVGQRGVKWETLWEKKHDFNATESSENEATKFSGWESEVAHNKVPEALYQPTNFVNHQMRSTLLMRSIVVARTNFAKINSDLDKTVKAIDVVSKGLLGLGVDPSMLPAAAAAVTPEKPTGDGVVQDPKPGTDTNNGAAAAVKTPAAIRTGETSLSNMQGQVEALKDIPANPQYQGYKAAANTALGKASGEMDKMKAAQVTMNSATATPAEKTQAKADYDTAQKEFNKQIGAAQSNVAQAQNLVPSAVSPIQNTPVADQVSAAERAKAEHNMSIGDRCIQVGVGDTGTAKQCKFAVSKRISTAVGVARGSFTSPLTATKAADIRSHISSACADLRNCKDGATLYNLAGCNTQQ